MSAAIASLAPSDGDDGTVPIDASRLAFLALAASGALAAIAWADGRALVNDPQAVPALWFALAALHLPFALHLMRIGVAPGERLSALLILGGALYGVKLLGSPLVFNHSDEFQHWATAQSILETGRLFLPNPLLQISPSYPGLELVDVALAKLGRVDPVSAGLVVAGAARLALIGGLFSFFRSAGLGGRAIGLAVLLYMDSDFTAFAGQFAYETLALALAATGLALAATARTSGLLAGWRATIACLACVAALVATHHVTSYLTAAYLLGAAALGTVLPSCQGRRLAGWCLALMCLGFVGGWDVAMGHPAWPYLAPAFGRAAEEVQGLLAHRLPPRTLFTAESGTGTVDWRRYLGLASVAVELVAIATGLLALWRERLKSIPRDGAARPLLAATALAYPALLLLRLTHAGWEVSNRSSAFTFVGVGFLGALGVTAIWAGPSRNAIRLTVISGLLTVTFLGGLTASCCTLQPNAIPVAADEGTRGREGVEAALWAGETLKPGQVIGADRVNRLLLATYGRKLVPPSGTAGELAPLILGDSPGAEERDALRMSEADYLLVDFRLSRGLPAYGHYFEEGEDTRFDTAPPKPAALAKFDGMSGADRVYDSGDLAIYDVRGLR